MWKKPIKRKGARESDFAYTVKLIIIKSLYDDVYDELTIKEIVENIQHYAKLSGIEFEFYNKDGTLKEVNYNTVVNDWIPKYELHACYDAYEREMKDESKIKALQVFDKKLYKDTVKDFKTIDKIDRRIDFLFHQQDLEGVDHTYRIAKLEETKNSIWHRICERLNLTSETENDNVDVPYVPVDDDPLHESNETREFWNDILWDLVDKRQ